MSRGECRGERRRGEEKGRGEGERRRGEAKIFNINPDLPMLCEPCGPGTYYNSAANTCDQCKAGYYSDDFASMHYSFRSFFI